MTEVRIRRAEKDDVAFVFALRNKEDVYRYLKNNHPLIDWRAHVAWFKAIVRGEVEKILFIIELRLPNKCDPIPVGYIRFNWEDKICWVAAIAVEASYRRQGIAFQAMMEAISKARQEARQRGLQYMATDIWEENQASSRLFEKLGFKRGLGDSARQRDEQGRLWIQHILPFPQ